MSDALKGLATAAKHVTEFATGVVEEAGSHLSKSGEVGGEVARTMTKDINQLLPAIQKAGYSVHGLDLDMAIPPKFVVQCRMELEVAEADRQALLESLSESRVSATAVKALFQFSDIQKGLSIGTLKPTEVLLEVGLTPALKVRYREEGVKA